ICSKQSDPNRCRTCVTGCGARLAQRSLCPDRRQIAAPRKSAALGPVRMRRDDCGFLQEKHADAIHCIYEATGVNLKTATEGEKVSLRARLMNEGRKAGKRFPLLSPGRARTPR